MSKRRKDVVGQLDLFGQIEDPTRKEELDPIRETPVGLPDYLRPVYDGGSSGWFVHDDLGRPVLHVTYQPGVRENDLRSYQYGMTTLLRMCEWYNKESPNAPTQETET
jgi:hypothetical protein